MSDPNRREGIAMDEGNITGRSITVAIGDRWGDSMTGAPPPTKQRIWTFVEELDAAAKEADTSARAVAQHDPYIVIVWLLVESDAHAVRRHLEARGYNVCDVSANYGVAMA